MIEAYSQGITVAVDSAIPFNQVTLRKGWSATPNGVASFVLNKAGVYKVSVNAVLASAAVGDVAIQLTKNGIAVPNAQATATIGTANNLETLSIDTLVQVEKDNTCRCCDSGTVIGVQNIGLEALIDNVDIVITKVC